MTQFQMILLVDFKHYNLNIYKTHKVAHLCYFYNACLLIFITNADNLVYVFQCFLFNYSTGF